MSALKPNKEPNLNNDIFPVKVELKRVSDHFVLTDKGWQKLKNLENGDFVQSIGTLGYVGYAKILNIGTVDNKIVATIAIEDENVVNKIIRGDISSMGYFVDTESEELQLTAVKHSLDAFKYIKNPYQSVKDYYENAKIKSLGLYLKNKPKDFIFHVSKDNVVIIIWDGWKDILENDRQAIAQKSLLLDYQHLYGCRVYAATFEEYKNSLINEFADLRKKDKILFVCTGDSKGLKQTFLWNKFELIFDMKDRIDIIEQAYKLNGTFELDKREIIEAFTPDEIPMDEIITSGSEKLQDWPDKMKKEEQTPTPVLAPTKEDEYLEEVYKGVTIKIFKFNQNLPSNIVVFKTEKNVPYFVNVCHNRSTFKRPNLNECMLEIKGIIRDDSQQSFDEYIAIVDKDDLFCSRERNTKKIKPGGKIIGIYDRPLTNEEEYRSILANTFNSYFDFRLEEENQIRVALNHQEVAVSFFYIGKLTSEKAQEILFSSKINISFTTQNVNALSDKMKIVAIQNYENIIDFINNPTIEMLAEACIKDPNYTTDLRYFISDDDFSKVSKLIIEKSTERMLTVINSEEDDFDGEDIDNSKTEESYQTLKQHAKAIDSTFITTEDEKQKALKTLMNFCTKLETGSILLQQPGEVSTISKEELEKKQNLPEIARNFLNQQNPYPTLSSAFTPNKPEITEPENNSNKTLNVLGGALAIGAGINLINSILSQKPKLETTKHKIKTQSKEEAIEEEEISTGKENKNDTSK